MKAAKTTSRTPKRGSARAAKQSDPKAAQTPVQAPDVAARPAGRRKGETAAVSPSPRETDTVKAPRAPAKVAPVGGGKPRGSKAAAPQVAKTRGTKTQDGKKTPATKTPAAKTPAAKTQDTRSRVARSPQAKASTGKPEAAERQAAKPRATRPEARRSVVPRPGRLAAVAPPPPSRQAAKAQAKSKTASAVVSPAPAPAVARPVAPKPRARQSMKPMPAAPAAVVQRQPERPTVVPPTPVAAEAVLVTLPQSAVQPPSPAAAPRPSASDDAASGPVPPMPNLEALATNSARLIEEMSRATAAALKPVEEGRAKPGVSDEVSDMVKTLGQVVERWAMDPQRVVVSQASLTKGFVDLWANTVMRLNGENAPPVAAPEPSDKRFRDPEWTANPVFDFIKQAYLLTSRWAEHIVGQAEGVDAHTKHKAEFYVRQLASALAPTNFVATNPELLRTTFKESGENLVRGMKMLAEDIEAGKGTLKLRQTSGDNFAVGHNMATTPGKVIFRNDLIELIQYEPTTDKVYKRPLLIVPPWINKFYILDLNAEKSFIRWAVSQGLTVFVISWVNPDERQARKSFEDYMREGIFEALDAVKAATGEEQVTAIGYCVGGTLLSVTLAYMAAIGDRRIESATLFTTQVDFTYAGDLAVFVDEDQIKNLEDRMYARGYLEGSSMASAFNMLRPNDLIWPYVVNVYLKGESPFPFDLLYWNSDSTRMPAANHSFYLRNCYLTNRLAKGEMEIGGEKLDLGKVTIPIYNLAAREDHIAPAKSVFKGSKCFGGPVTYVLAGSGHIAGVVNPAGKPKYQYWTGGKVEGTLDEWIAGATEHPGTWWPHWMEWIRAQSPALVDAREPGGGKLAPLCDAPGTYVKVRA